MCELLDKEQYFMDPSVIKDSILSHKSTHFVEASGRRTGNGLPLSSDYTHVHCLGYLSGDLTPVSCNFVLAQFSKAAVCQKRQPNIDNIICWRMLDKYKNDVQSISNFRDISFYCDDVYLIFP